MISTGPFRLVWFDLVLVRVVANCYIHPAVIVSFRAVAEARHPLHCSTVSCFVSFRVRREPLHPFHCTVSFCVSFVVVANRYTLSIARFVLVSLLVSCGREALHTTPLYVPFFLCCRSNCAIFFFFFFGSRGFFSRRRARDVIYHVVYRLSLTTLANMAFEKEEKTISRRTFKKCFSTCL